MMKKILIYVGNVTGMTSKGKNNCFSKQQIGDSTIMICEGFGWWGKSYIILLNNSMNTRDYQKVLNDHLLLISEEIGGPHFVSTRQVSQFTMKNLILNGFCAVVHTLLTACFKILINPHKKIY